jgi:uncharacterized protein (TIGR02246 family)
MHAAAPLPDPARSRAVDEQSVVQTLLTVVSGFVTRDVEAVCTAYSSDADWIDADGTALHGRDAIVERVRRVFHERPHAADARVGGARLSLRWLNDDAVVATAYVERRRTQLDGRTLPRLRSYSLKVLTRLEHNKWRIVSDIDADSRDDGQLERDRPSPTCVEAARRGAKDALDV